MHMIKNTKHKTRVSSKGQIVIPGEIRKKYEYGKGTELIITPLDENRMLLERVPKLSKLFGLVGDVEASKVLLMEREREVRAEMKRHRELGK